MLSKKTHLLERGIRNITSILCYVSMGMLAILMLLSVADVTGRYILDKPIKGTFEISELLLAGVIFFGLAYALSAGKHITVDALVTRLRPRLQAILGFVTSFLALIIFGLMVWRSAKFALKSWETHTSVNVIYIPLFPFQLFVSLGVFFLCVELIIQMLHFFTAARKGA